jgi:hypothetical protein
MQNKKAACFVAFYILKRVQVRPVALLASKAYKQRGSSTHPLSKEAPKSAIERRPQDRQPTIEEVQ